MAKNKVQSFSDKKPKPERVWLLLDFLSIGTTTKVFLGPSGQPMIVNETLRQPVPIRSERLVDYLYLLYEQKLGHHDIPSSSAIRAVQRVLAGKALMAGAQEEEQTNADPLFDTLRAVLEKATEKTGKAPYQLPDLDKALKAAVGGVGYDQHDLPIGTAELSKQVKERTEALLVAGYTVAFSRTNTARFVTFANLAWKPPQEKDQGEGGQPANDETEELPTEELVEDEIGELVA